MNKPFGTLWILVALSAALLSVPWLVPHCGWISLFALVPLLCAERVAEQNDVKHFWIWHFSCFVLWNATTTFWVANATVGGAIFAILANSLQMSLIFGLFRLGKTRLRGVLPYILLMCAWIAWERWYLVSAQISWPWLVLGNAFAKSIKTIQWYEFTGTLGGSLWIWTANLTLFALLVNILEGTFFRLKPIVKWAFFGGAVLVFALPFSLSAYIWNNYNEDSIDEVNVLMGQPNINPYQKHHSLSQFEQNSILLEEFESALNKNSKWEGLLIAPETFTSDICLNDVRQGETFQAFQSLLRKHPRANMLFGASTYELFNQRSAPSILAREYGSMFREDHNSAIVTDTSLRYDLFHKSKLVVGVESTPYPKFFVPIDNKLGGLMGRDIGQAEVSLLNYHKSDSTIIPFGCAVCYESVYPEYCTQYVRKGAQFMTIITNDAWWGNTPGYKQHASYASLRAIELRRYIARCGNTGISGVINERGEYLSSSTWWHRQTLEGSVKLSGKQTFFVRYGDIVGRICTLCFLLLFAILLVLLPARRRV